MEISIATFGLCIVVFTSLSSIPAHASPSYLRPRNHLKFILDSQNLGPWKIGILDSNAQAPAPSKGNTGNTLVLAANRTRRPDILHRLKRYRDGWDIENKHYWASVGFTGAFGFSLAVVWFLSFGLVLVVHLCCKWRINVEGKGSVLSQRICLILLIVFTCSAATGCILLTVGQDKFHGEALHTLGYVVNQADYSVQTLRNVTEYLALAKTISVAQIFLPSNVIGDIDKLNADLKTAADTLSQTASQNSGKIRKVFDAVRTSLITVAVVMLILSLLGLFLSIFGYQHAIYIFIISGWLLVAVTFILCGVFVILDNAIADTCMAMGEWVEHPHAETALSNILPCVDQRTTNKTLIQSKQVINDVVNIVNQYIYTFANLDLPPEAVPNYYNQSGPLMPPLCYPYDDQLQLRQCTSFEVSIANASLVWENYTCTVSPETGFCASTGRLTPDMYDQMVAAVNISFALEYYTPPLLSFQDCNFVRDTFRNITSDYCPPLENHLRVVNAGLALISVGVMLCLALWILYANRPQREEVFAKNLSSRIKGSFSSFRKNKNDDGVLN